MQVKRNLNGFKMTKKYIYFLFVLFFSLYGCGGGNNTSLIGTKWETSSVDAFGTSSRTVLEFENDHSVTMTSYDNTWGKSIIVWDYIYDNRDDSWILLTSGQSSYLSKSQIFSIKSRCPTFTISNDKLIMSVTGGEIEYVKIY